MTTTESPERKRGGCLTAFLVLMLVVSPLYVLVGLLPTSEEVSELLPKWPQWAILLMGLLGLANFVFALAIWKWKRWGVYGFAGAAIVFFVANVIRGGVGIYGAFFGLAITIGILVRLVRPVWQEME
ncbi:MAG: hypothetical protein KJ638_09265 [Chloroflexi bacterium]|nr:hypothetical protein [Chloroflexota bacterium]